MVTKRRPTRAPRGMLDDLLERHIAALTQAQAGARHTIMQHVLGHGEQSAMERLLVVEQALAALDEAYSALLPVVTRDNRIGFINPERENGFRTVRYVATLMPYRDPLASASWCGDEGLGHA